MELNKVVREAAVINMLDVAESDALLDCVKTELWCIREGINTEEHPEIWDITLGSMTTTHIIKFVLNSSTRGREEQAAFLLCTIQELS